MAVVGAAKLEILMRKAAGLDIDKNKAKEITDIVEKKLYDLLLIGERNANYNGREVILATMPPLKYPLEVELEKRLPEIVGTLIYILAQLIKEIAPESRKPSSEDIQKAGKILDLTM